MARYLQNKEFAITPRKGSHMTLRNGMLLPCARRQQKLRLKTLFSILLYSYIGKEDFVRDYKSRLRP